MTWCTRKVSVAQTLCHYCPHSSRTLLTLQQPRLPSPNKVVEYLVWYKLRCAPLSPTHMLQHTSWSACTKLPDGMQNQAPRVCKACQGGKQVECSFCHGTAVMQLGDTLYCSDTGCQLCPACRGQVRLHTAHPTHWSARPYASKCHHTFSLPNQ